MRLGVTRYGPCAPSTFQFGKYEDFTRIGVPVRSTSKSIVSNPVRTFVTVACGSGRTGGVSPSRTRVHDDGPSAARYTFHFVGSTYHVIAGPFARTVWLFASTGAVCGSDVP